MDDMLTLKALQLDALREVANIGAGHAATALSQMIGQTIMISVPTINMAKLEDVPSQVDEDDEPSPRCSCTSSAISRGAHCSCFRGRPAFRLAELMIRRPSRGTRFSEMEQSASRKRATSSARRT
jgi:chemotaxis protein CheC